MMAILDIYTNESEAGFVNDLLRKIAHSWINIVAFWLLGIMYEIFFNVATVELLENATIRNFYGRVQLILGVFMVFRLSITVLQAIVDPDRVQDKKEGFSAIIKRVVIGLLMLTVLTPINIPNASNEYQIELNNNGLLFGTLYSLQYRILEQNTLGRLILGTTDNADDSSTSLENSSAIFKSTIAKAFVNINLKEGETDDTKSANWMCGEDTPETALKEYEKLDADPSILFSTQMVTLSCSDGKTGILGTIGGLGNRIVGKDRYVFNYILFVPFIVAIVFTIILLGFTVDIAIRAIKLAVLRLIAPIPIIAYMGPESKENSAFQNWIRAVVSTYLDLFIRLAVVYFVLYIIIDMITNGVIIKNGTGAIGIISCIFIWLGLFLFARQAPKFILDVLGVKSLGSNIGLGAILGGGAMLVGGARTGIAAARQEGGSRIMGAIRGAGSGFAQGALNGMTATNEAQATGKDMPLHNVYAQNRDLMAQMRTGDKDARGGAIGYMQDRLNFQNRELRARSLGIGRNAYAAALYEDEVAGDRYRDAQAKSSSAASKVSAMKGAGMTFNQYQSAMNSVGNTHVTQDDYKQYGGMMTKDELSVKYGRTVTDAEYGEFVTKYQENVDNWMDALGVEEKARVGTLISGAAKKGMDNARGTLGVGPRVSDIYTEGYRSQREVVMDDDRVALDAAGQPIVDPNRTGSTKDRRATGEAARGQYTFHDSVTSFDGTIDDSSFGASGRGSGGGPTP